MGGTGYELCDAQRQAIGAAPVGLVRRVRLVTAAPDDTDATLVAGRLADAVAANDILRTTFVRRGGVSDTVQVIGDAGKITIPLEVDEPDDLNAEGLLDLEAGPAIRVTLSRGRLVITAASAVADERSLRILADRLVGRSEPDPDPLQLVDYASWESEQAGDDAAEARIARGFWQDFAAVPGAAHAQPIRAQRAIPLVDAEHEVDEWLAAWVALQTRYAQPDAAAPVIALAVDGRVDDDLRSAIGPYERYVPLSIADDPGATLPQLAMRARGDRSAAARFAAHAPPPPSTAAAFAVRAGDDVTTVGGVYALELVVVGRRAELRFAPDVVDPAAAERLAAQLVQLLAAGGQPLAQVDVRGEDERNHLDRWLTGPDANEPAPAGSLAGAVLAHAHTSPGASAVADGREILTYAELGSRSAALAHQLPGDGRPVALLLDRGVDLIVGALAVLRSGAPYVALEPASPDARLAEQLELVGAAAVITSAALAHRVPAGADVIRGDQVDSVAPSPASAERMPASTDPAYLIFTSGSTGRPKLVEITHGNALAYTRGVTARLGLGPATRFAAVTGLSTDLGNTAVFGALVNGGCLEVVADDAALDAAQLGRLIEQKNVTAMKTTPSHLRVLLAPGARLPLPLLVIGGEPLDGELVSRAYRAGVQRIVNHYGPTETTVGVLTFDVPTDPPAPIPLGRPLDHVRAHVIDQHGAPSPLGAVGQLGIAGASVSPGYIGRPDENAARFVTEPGRPDGRMYLTGDLVRVDDNGLIEFHGRVDDQVKIRGYRVELGEIETALRADPTVDQAAVAFDADTLTAYVRAHPGFDPQATLARLATRLPAHLQPAAVVAVEAIPLTPSGKVDRKRLATVQARTAPPERTVRTPSTATEAELLAIWQDVLSVGVLSVDDNFFRVGGHSLLATKVIARARAHFAVELPLHVIFTTSTITAMAAEIDARRSAAEPDDDGLGDLLAELESMSEHEAERLLRQDPASHADDA